MFSIKESIHINAPIEDVWKVTALDFGGIYKWQSGVNHSTAEGTGPNAAPCQERVCSVNVKGFSKTHEQFVSYEPKQHRFAYKVVQGMPSFVKSAVNEWTHVREGKGTRLTMEAQMNVPGLMGFIMGPLMRRQMKKLLGEALEELKFYLEEGKPHPRKLAAMQAYAKKQPILAV